VKKSGGIFSGESLLKNLVVKVLPLKKVDSIVFIDKIVLTKKRGNAICEGVIYCEGCK
jgi:hypothetical protein